MKKKYIRTLLGIFTIFALLSLINSCNNNENNNTASKASEDSVIKKKIARGEYLAYHVSACINCHSQRDYKQFSGRVIKGTEGMGGEIFNEIYGIPGVVFARNITPDTVNGIGKWTDDEIARAITKGIKQNGDTLYPIMPYPHYNKMSKEDVYSIIAFLRTLKPNPNKVLDRELSKPIAAVYPDLQNASVDNNVQPDMAEMVNYGAYMVNIAACRDCHTPMDDKGKYILDKAFSGGFTFNMGSFKANSANITPDTATGIGKWTEEQFLEKFKLYRDPAVYATNPGKINSIMPWNLFTVMDDNDIRAIYQYLRTIPPINHRVEKYPK